MRRVGLISGLWVRFAWSSRRQASLAYCHHEATFVLLLRMPLMQARRKIDGALHLLLDALYDDRFVLCAALHALLKFWSDRAFMFASRQDMNTGVVLIILYCNNNNNNNT